MIRVVLVTAVRLYREGLAEILSREEPLEVIGTAADAQDGLRASVELRPDVLLLDMTLPHAIQAVRSCVQRTPDVAVVALALPEEEDNVVACAEAGVSGYVTHEQSIEDVVGVIESIARGEAVCSPRMAAALLRRVSTLAAGQVAAPSAARLTGRELEIVGLIDHGLSNKQIARRLVIELPTVKNHVHNILEKLHVSGRHEAVERVRANGQMLLPDMSRDDARALVDS